VWLPGTAGDARPRKREEDAFFCWEWARERFFFRQAATPLIAAAAPLLMRKAKKDGFFPDRRGRRKY